jgi:murein DD-endopeptidase MepM/ murein hydrolase activator NlpD
MKFKAFIFGLVFVTPVSADSFLRAQSFPKTFEDLSFKSRMEFYTDDYKLYEPEYDENGVCISGCAYQGITIKEDMQSVDEATNDMAALVQSYENNANPTNSASTAQGTNSSSAATGTTQTEPTAPTTQTDNTTGVAQDWCRNGKTTKLPLRYPVDMTNFKYKITSDFGFRKGSSNGAGFHPALDIGCPTGTPVYATADGIVEVVGNDAKLGGGGRYINIKHDHSLITQYLHLDSVSVSKGQAVKACQQIGISGNSGQSKSGKTYPAHLDYRVRFSSNRNKFVDILCPCKSSYRSSGTSSSSSLDVNCAHSLFNASYKFRNGSKHSDWRISNNHCMTTVDSLLPDEKR